MSTSRLPHYAWRCFARRNCRGIPSPIPDLQAMQAVSKVPGEAKLVDAAIHHTKCALQFAGSEAAWQWGASPGPGGRLSFPCQLSTHCNC